LNKNDLPLKCFHPSMQCLFYVKDLFMFLKMFLMGKTVLFKVIFTRFWMWTLEGCFRLSPTVGIKLLARMCLIILRILFYYRAITSMANIVIGILMKEEPMRFFTIRSFLSWLWNHHLSTFVILLTKMTLSFLMLLSLFLWIPFVDGNFISSCFFQHCWYAKGNVSDSACLF